MNYTYKVTQKGGASFALRSKLDPNKFIAQERGLGTGLASVWMLEGNTWVEVYKP